MTEATLSELIDTVSPSRIDTATTCLARFRFRYLERIRGPKRIAMSFGSALDAASNSCYQRKIDEPGYTMPASEVADCFAAEWDSEQEQIEDWGKDKPDEMLDTGVKCSTLWRDNVAQYVAPLQVQPKLVKELKDSRGDKFTLLGYPDVIATVRNQTAIADLKTSGKVYATNSIVKRSQPPAYTILAEIPRFEYHVVTTAKKPKVQLLGATVSDTQRQNWIDRAGMVRRHVAHAHKTGDWIPNRGHMTCSRRFCDHWRECEKAYGGEVSP